MNLRLEKLSEVIEKAGLDAVVINPGATLSWLTGANFHLMERPVVMFFVPGRDPVLVLPTLDMLTAQQISYHVDIFPYAEDPSTWEEAFRSAAQSLGLDAVAGTSGKRLGLDPRALRLLDFKYIQQATHAADFSDASEAFGSLRVRKEEAEVEKIRRAVQIAEAALKATIPLIKIGMSERELATTLTIQLLQQGSAPDLPFAPIVSSGPNSANPHATPSDRQLQPGDLLVVDWGARYEGYISDLTRTFAVGSLGDVDPELVRAYNFVKHANTAARAAAMPGVTTSELDNAARAVIERSGFGAFFTHRTGHGIGLEAHEAPYLRADNLQVMLPGMTFTIEPGIYLPGRGGVRIEDNMLMIENGAECLSDLEREMVTIQLSSS